MVAVILKLTQPFKLPASTTFTNPTTRAKAITDALETIEISGLSTSVKQVALKNLRRETFTTYTVPIGNSKNSVKFNCVKQVCK